VRWSIWFEAFNKARASSIAFQKKI